MVYTPPPHIKERKTKIREREIKRHSLVYKFTIFPNGRLIRQHLDDLRSIGNSGTQPQAGRGFLIRAR
jgi:hypothetical protein